MDNSSKPWFEQQSVSEFLAEMERLNSKIESERESHSKVWKAIADLVWSFCRKSTEIHLLCSKHRSEDEISRAISQLSLFVGLANVLLVDDELGSVLSAAKEKLADCEAEKYSKGLPDFDSDREEAAFKLLKTLENCQSRIDCLQDYQIQLDLVDCLLVKERSNFA